MVWSLQDAKNKFSEVVDRSQTEGPQRVQRHGKDAVYVVSCEDWYRIQGKELSLAEFFLASPLGGAELDVERDRSLLRPVEL